MMWPGRRPLFTAKSLSDLRKIEEETSATTEDKVGILVFVLPCGSISSVGPSDPCCKNISKQKQNKKGTFLRKIAQDHHGRG